MRSENEQFSASCDSPLGRICITADEKSITGLWFADQTTNRMITDGCCKEENSIIHETIRWLAVYFSGTNPDFLPPVRYTGTPFQHEVWDMLRTIPYGKTMTYGQIAQILAVRHGMTRMAAQAVGGAVGRNPVSIIVPCHRVIGGGGNLTGYAGGLERKEALLRLEHIIQQRAE
jgi:methylated-DNA-[protein]-cysteine S-methyltransferase